MFESEAVTLKVKEALEDNNIYPRRNFYPSLDALDYVETEKLMVSNEIWSVLCVHRCFFDLSDEEQRKISKIIL